jgi:large subunit ribosomal protein L18Ae
MYKEYRELTRADAAVACYQDMAARHRARFSSIQIIKLAEVANANVRRPYIKDVLAKNLKFPLPHRLVRPSKRSSIFAGKRPSTF